MRTQLIAIGNSRGVRIPKAVLVSTGLSGEVDMEVRGNEITIRAANPRQDWDKAFAVASGDARMVWPEAATNWDRTEWEW